MTTRVAILRGADQRAGRAPQHCVKTGLPTDGAVRVVAVALGRADLAQLVAGYVATRVVAWMLRRSSFATVVAVSPLAWPVLVDRRHGAPLRAALAAPEGATLRAHDVMLGVRFRDREVPSPAQMCQARRTTPLGGPQG